MEFDKDDRVDSVTKDVPMAFEYTPSIYYVRECYHIYYGQIKELLESRGKKYISVTGTPGIGKSIFYLYVFNRMRKEYPFKTIVAVSFTKERDLVKCVVFYPDGSCKLCLDNFGRAYVPFNEEASIHLYDGPPKVQPPDSQMVAFTSPNEAWLNSIYKAANHCELYMPVWTFQELCDANELLGLDIEMERLQQYFGIFGGVARYCLGSESFSSGMQKKKEALGKISSFDDVKSILCGRKDLYEVCHRLFYYEPLAIRDLTAAELKELEMRPQDLPYFFELYGSFFYFKRLCFGSEWIALQVEERIQEKQRVERVDLIRWLDGVRKVGTL